MFKIETSIIHLYRNSAKTGLLLITFALLMLAIPWLVNGDVVTDWNKNMLQAGLATHSSPLVMSRAGAIVQASVFDAVNGIERRYKPIHVESDAPHGASKRAAAIQAAYASLLILFPSEQSTFDAERASSLAAISSGPGAVKER